MDFSEQNLEGIIWDNIPSRDKLTERGLDEFNGFFNAKRQLRIGNYGIADIITQHRQRYKNQLIKVWELKKSLINRDTLLQSVRYSKGVMEYIKTYKPYSCKLEIVLIGRNIDTVNDWIYLFDIFNLWDFVFIYKYSYGIDGIEFKRIDLSEYRLDEGGF